MIHFPRALYFGVVLSASLLTGCGSGLFSLGTSSTPSPAGPVFGSALQFTSGATLKWAITGAGPASMTVELLYRPITVAGTQLFVSLQNSGGTDGHTIHMTGGNINSTYPSAACGAPINATTVFAPVVGTLYHLALVTDASGAKVFINGVQQGSNGTAYSPCGSHTFMTIGSTNAGTLTATAVIDELRISGMARYAGGFTPPTAPLTPDANTLFLFHFDSSASVVDYTSTWTASAPTTLSAFPTLISSPF